MTLKIAIIGASCVGKSTYFDYLAEINGNKTKPQSKRYRRDYVYTSDMNVESMKLSDVDIALWDTAGQEKTETHEDYSKWREIYLKGSDAVIIMYDVTKLETRDKIKHWCDLVTKVCGKVPIAVVGNKCDDVELTSQHIYRPPKGQHFLISIRANSSYDIRTVGYFSSKIAVSSVDNNADKPLKWLMTQL